MDKTIQQSLEEFPTLHIPEESFSGADLLQTFNNLGINIGNVSKLTIDALFDTDCKATKEILEWLCRYLSTDNVLTAQEIEEYKELEENDEVLTERQYNIELAKIVKDYPGILDCDNNCMEVKCMEDELEILVNRKQHLENVVILNNGIKNKLSKKFSQLQEKEISCQVQKTNAQDECLALSRTLDQTREKLQLQILRYSRHLNNFDCDNGTFISNTPTVKYDQQYTDVTSCLKLFLKQESLLNEHCNYGADYDSLAILSKRIAKGYQNYVIFQSEVERFKAELEFLKNIDLDEFSTSQILADSVQMNTKVNIFTQKEILDKLYLKVSNIAQNAADAIIDKPEIDMLHQAINAKSEKLNALNYKYSQIKLVLVNHVLLYLLLNKEKNDIQSTDNFFCNVHEYITDVVYNSKLRTEIMADIINSYNLYKKLPIENKLPLLKVVKDLLLQNTNGTISIFDLVKDFYNDCQKVEQQVFLNDIVNHRQLSKKLESEIENIKEFLITGPTSQIQIVPNDLCDAFDEINAMLESQQASLKKSAQLLNNSIKLLSEKKWFKIKRQLWMYFLVEPKKVIQVINQIKAHSNQVGSQT